WLDEHPEARPLGLAYYGAFDPRVAGIDFRLPPPGPPHARPGWFAVSVSLVRGMRAATADGTGGWVDRGADAYTYFRGWRPVARAGYSIHVYHVSTEEAERVRRTSGR